MIRGWETDYRLMWLQKIQSSINGAQDEQEEDANNSVVNDEPEIDEEIDQEARPPVIVQQAPDRRYPSRNRRQPERYQAGFS